MNVENLPIGNAPMALPLPHFPTLWQAVVWRNWGLVPAERLAQVLGTSAENIRNAAAEMGLNPNRPADPQWIVRGYQTIIRHNWHLLNYEQLLQLLEWQPERMAYLLKEEDFLWTKLGGHKPLCTPVQYEELSQSQKDATAQMRKWLDGYIAPEQREYAEPPFSFGKLGGVRHLQVKSKFDFNFIHCYVSNCGDVLGDLEHFDPLPETLLQEYQKMGITGVWFHAVLYTLVPIPGAESFSEGWQKRQKALAKLVERCGKYGVKIFLYLNEPRALPQAFYDIKPTWRGIYEKGFNTNAICTTATKEPLEWLKNAVKTVFSTAPGLGGAFCITMSENATHCNSRWRRAHCPHCSKVPPEQIIADVLKAIESGMHEAAPEARMIAYDWAWERNPGDQENEEYHSDVIKLLPSSIAIASVSEWGKNTNVGGVREYLTDYSISQIGPSEEALATWRHAKAGNHDVVAKVQLNNCWELAAVPYMPVPYLVNEHLDNLKRAGVNGLMLSWTLGGYPGGNLELLNGSPEDLAAVKFHAGLAEKICDVWRTFSNAYREYPFTVPMLYTGPTNYGPMSRFHSQPTGLPATMIGFPYDDITYWRAVYPEDVCAEQFRKMTEGWKAGLEQLSALRDEVQPSELKDYEELDGVAHAAYCHLRSAYNHIRFVLARNRRRDLDEMGSIVQEEIGLVQELHALARKDTRLGFEASNHYFYTLNDLQEKIISCCSLLREFQTEKKQK